MIKNFPKLEAGRHVLLTKYNSRYFVIADGLMLFFSGCVYQDIYTCSAEQINTDEVYRVYSVVNDGVFDRNNMALIWENPDNRPNNWSY